MRAVIDTNVLVSAMLTPAGTSAQLIEVVRTGKLQSVLSHEIFMEYVQVLNRPKFGFDKTEVANLLEDLVALALFIRPPSHATTSLPDPDDAPFIAAALHAVCPIVTGNTRDFPPETGAEILSPAEALARLQGGA